MVKCSFCGHGNEDGVLFCDKCKTDLSIPAPEISGSGGEIMYAESMASSEGDFTETLHLARVPMVEKIGASLDEGGDLTKPSPAIGQPLAPAQSESATGSLPLSTPTPLSS